MPNYDAPPGASDLSTFLLTGEFVSIALGTDLQGPCDAAHELFQERTGFTPFLASAATTRRFDAPGPRPARGVLGGARFGGGKVLDLEGGIVGLPTSVLVDGDLMIEGEDFRCLPRNADTKGKPFTLIEFLRPVYSAANGIAILAPWGYCRAAPDGAGFPALAWQGILQGAASSIFYTLPNNASVQSVSRDGLSESFEIASTMTPGQRGDGLKAQFETAVKKFRRGI